MSSNVGPKPTATAPTMRADAVAPPASSTAEVAAFLKVAAKIAPPKTPGARGRLVFAMDATMSRQPTWDMAQRIQSDMFEEAGKIGTLDIQLVYFRGQGECRASAFVSEAAKLGSLMRRIACEGGHTQIVRVLDHVADEVGADKVHALVFVGDAMEEAIDDVAAAAGRLALKGVPAFVFQEGHDPNAERAFREIARITRGAYARFDPGSARQLAELLKAVAVFASGGRAALVDLSRKGDRGAMALIGQMS